MFIFFSNPDKFVSYVIHTEWAGVVVRLVCFSGHQLLTDETISAKKEIAIKQLEVTNLMITLISQKKQEGG